MKNGYCDIYAEDGYINFDKIRPMDGYIIMIPDKVPMMIKSLIVPDIARHIEKIGTVVAVADNVKDVKVDDRITFKISGVSPINWGKTFFFLVPIDSVIATFVD